MKKVMMLTALLCGGLMLNAQKQADKNSPQYKLADELMTTMNMGQTINDGVNDMVEMQAKSNPMLSDKKEPLKAFMMKYMNWDALRDDYTSLYATEFTEGEIKDMIAFYKTPTGKKVASKMSVLMIKGTELGQSKMQEHMDELMKLMQK